MPHEPKGVQLSETVLLFIPGKLREIWGKWVKLSGLGIAMKGSKKRKWFKPGGDACQDPLERFSRSFLTVAPLGFCQLLLQTGLINKLI